MFAVSRQLAPQSLLRDAKTRSTVFALTSARSGTMCLSELLKRNAPQCTVVHESNDLNLWNPSMFGRVIYDRATGQFDAVRAVLRRKRRAIDLCGTPIYIETSHAFLKSYWDLAPEFFPQSKVFHLIRHPLEVACSESNRERWMVKRRKYPVRYRYRYYRGRDGRRYKRWTLTELEPIFSSFDLSQLTLFQRYLIQWIELENRAMDYLQRFDMHARCLTLHSPQDLNSPQAAAAILDFVGVGHSGVALLPGVQNATPPGYETTLGDSELHQCSDVVAALPATYLEIFQHEPYAGQPWAALLSK
ncbi:hypothetical protein MHAE_03805 [Mycobacterium haemophilum DSM 44634]|nr:hypothetical protein [Mycobacterium haemophilum]